MIIITLNITNLNDSLQVGDLVYSTPVNTQAGANDQEAVNIGPDSIVGVLRRITIIGDVVTLDVDETVITNPNIPNNGDFILFSKYDQTDGDVLGYYARAKFVNNSKKKAELFSVGSEVVINSK
jgi:hypothetical protein